jgi:hypothetical protein
MPAYLNVATSVMNIDVSITALFSGIFIASSVVWLIGSDA